jgi:large subunit ribosomal protein L3
MGSERVTTQGLEVVEVRPEENLIFIRGSVPGPKRSLVLIRRSIKG